MITKPKRSTLASNMISLAILTALAVMCLNAPKPVTAPKAPALSDAELFCLVQNIYHEARGESAWGQLAVAYVTLNRVKSGIYPASICGVVYQLHQFAWTGDRLSDQMPDLKALSRSVDVALAAWRGTGPNPIGKALHFYAHHKVRPYWADAAEWKIVVDNHTFLTLERF